MSWERGERAGARGASWSELEQAGSELERGEQAGASWE